MSEVQNDIMTKVSQQEANDHLVITMTDRPPIRIRKSQWSIIASASRVPSSHRKWHIKVRYQKFLDKKIGKVFPEDKYIIYGMFLSEHKGEEDIRVGYFADKMDQVIDMIHKVAEEINAPGRLANDCIANLPAEEI